MINARRTIGAVGLSLALALGATACGSEVDAIASDSCDLLKSVDIQKLVDEAMKQAMSGEEVKTPAALAEFEKKAKALEKRAKKADISDKEMEAAVKKQCGDEVKKWEKFAEG